MRSRLGLHSLLVMLEPHTYFQPDENVQMQYPAIVYSLSNIETRRADNLVYTATPQYSVTYITEEPDVSEKLQLLLSLPNTSYDSMQISDGLYHHYLTIYY